MDQTVFRAIHIGWHSAYLDPFFWILSTTGLGHVQIVLSFLFMPWRYLLSGGNLKTAFAQGRLNLTGLIILAWAVSGTINSIWKQEIPRERPSNFVWAHPQESIFSNSFASGHTATSFCIAATIALFCIHRGKRGYAVLALLWACLVGLSRMYRGVHWPTDVIAGFFDGVSCALLLYVFGRKLYIYEEDVATPGQQPPQEQPA
jgi:undecaprenyl-diphosphatase